MSRTIESVPSPAPAKPAEAGAGSPGFARSLRHVLWMSSSGVITRILNLARGILLARLLTPFDFGVYGLGGSIVGIKERFADIGAGVFLVYHPREIGEHRETVFWANLGLSSLLLTLLAIAAPFLARVYREPLLTPVLVLLGLGVWARVNASIHQSLLRTESRFRALAVINNCSSAAWLGIAAALAWRGFGVWALVDSAVAANVVLAASLIVTQGWRPRWHLSKASLRVMGGFSFWFLGQGIGWYLVGNMDNLLVGRFLGMSLLGVYALAFNYALLPVTTVGNAMGSVAYAELPKLFDRPESFWRTFRAYSRVQALVACLAAFAAAAAAPDVIPLVFGAKWSAAIAPFQILSVYAAVQCLWLDAFLACGDFRASCLVGLGSVAGAAAAVGIGLRFGLVGVAGAMLLMQVVFNVVSLRVMSRSWRQLGAVARATAPYLAGGMGAAAVALGFRSYVLAGRIGYRLPTALLTVAVFTAIYGLLFRKDLSAVLRQVQSGSAARPE